jgi:probable HAF family extracellular repeat protein
VIKDLGVLLPTDVFSQAQAINDKGQVVGNSCDASFNCRPFVWQYGAMTDLNTLIPPDSPLQLIFAAAINAEGQITGVALDKNTGETPAFVATPETELSATQVARNPSSQGVLPEDVRKLLQRRMRFGRFGVR